MNGPERAELMQALVKKTEEGGVQEWVERIAAVARRAGAPMDQVSWQGSPSTVAFNVVETSVRYRFAEKLKAEVEKL